MPERIHQTQPNMKKSPRVSNCNAPPCKNEQHLAQFQSWICKIQICNIFGLEKTAMKHIYVRNAEKDKLSHDTCQFNQICHVAGKKLDSRRLKYIKYVGYRIKCDEWRFRVKKLRELTQWRDYSKLTLMAKDIVLRALTYTFMSATVKLWLRKYE